MTCACACGCRVDVLSTDPRRRRCARCCEAHPDKKLRATPMCACPCGCASEVPARDRAMGMRRCVSCRRTCGTWRHRGPGRACEDCGKWCQAGQYCRACARARHVDAPPSFTERTAQDAAMWTRRDPRPSGPVRRAVYERTEFDVMCDGT